MGFVSKRTEQKVDYKATIATVRVEICHRYQEIVWNILWIYIIVQNSIMNMVDYMRK